MRLRLRLGIVVTVVMLLAGCASPSGERLVPANMPELKEALGVVQEPLSPLAKAVTNASVVAVGSPVRFSAEGTSDPQGLPLAYAWAFGDGATGEGAEVAHAYEAPGEYAARLTVTNAGGAADHAVVTVQVLARDQAPVVVLRVLDEQGNALTAAPQRGQKVVLDASSSKDPEGGALSYDWDLGDGTTSHEPRVAHAWKDAGRWPVSLKVTDPAGRATQVAHALAVDGTYEASGRVDLLTPGPALAFPVAAGAREVVVTLAFDGMLGANDLTLVVKDGAGDEVARVKAPTPPGAREQTRVATLDASALAAAAPGAWRAEVVREAGSPAGVEYGLSARQSY